MRIPIVTRCAAQSGATAGQTRHYRLAGRFVFATAILVLGSADAQAGITLYNTAAGYLANSINNTTDDFTGLAAPGSFNYYPTPPGYTSYLGVTYTIDHSTGNDGSLFVIDPGYAAYAPDPVLSSQESTDGVNNIQITLSNPVTALATNLTSFDGTPIQITLSTGDTFSVTPTQIGDTPAYRFIGLTSTAPITSLTLVQGSNDVLNMKDFTFGTAAPVPETSSLMAFGCLLAGSSLAIRRRTRTR